eukprot:TRINITY_DN253_c0_g1_i1.p1 TRINITY_DN253_c0_g1~~TRINITY_DN253_c0_g1_i1.p1  ORF type:complete len:302 (-),score=89.97 TRINITY_DN253_c0_g1_i1:690-1490(-)
MGRSGVLRVVALSLACTPSTAFVLAPGGARVCRTHAAVRVGAPAGTVRLHTFDESRVIEHLENDMKADLALLSFKFGKFISSIEDIEDIHVGRIDGDFMSIDVVYCNKDDDTCVAVEVPIQFPHHCDTEQEIDDAIHELEEMVCNDGDKCETDWESGAARRAAAAALDPALVETMRRIEAVMTADFQDELLSFVARYSAVPVACAVRRCEMQSLTPYGFGVAAEAAGGGEAVPMVYVPFDKECKSASDFQQQILSLSARCLQQSSA